MSDDEPNTTPSVRNAVIIIALIGFVAAGLIRWYNHIHPPYKWPVIPPPNTKYPKPNAYDIYNDAYALAIDRDVAGNGYLNPGTPSYGLPTHTQAELDKAAADNLPMVAKVREGFRYAYLSPPRRSFSAIFPNYGHDRYLARVLLFEGLYAASKTQFDAALAYEVDAVRLGSDQMHDESLIGPLVGIACEAIGRRHAWDITVNVSGRVARREAARLEDIDSKAPSSAQIMTGEKWSTEASLIEMFKQPHWQAGFYPEPATGSGAFLRDKWARYKCDATTPDTVMKAYDTYVCAMITNQGLPYHAYLLAAKPKPPTDPITPTVVPGVDSIIEQVDINFALNELLAATLAIRAYKLDHGRNPAKLAELVPGYVKRIPTDPFADGKPLTYKLTASGYRLYSIGADGVDDGGKPLFDPSRTPASRYRVRPGAGTLGDIVAGVNY